MDYAYAAHSTVCNNKNTFMQKSKNVWVWRKICKFQISIDSEQYLVWMKKLKLWNGRAQSVYSRN